MENHFGVYFKNNGNSFASCFQYVEMAGADEDEAEPRRMLRRIKVYNKVLAFLQSETAKKGIGMNLKTIYYSGAKMYKKLREAVDFGLCRIEISYSPVDRQQEQELYVEDFPDRAEVDLDNAFRALCRVKGICYELPML